MARQHSLKTGTKISPETLLWAVRMDRRNLFVHIDSPIAGTEGNTSYHDILEAMTDLRAENNNLINFRKLFKVLTYREKFILVERANAMTLQECAEVLDISREMVRQVEKSAILKVRAAIRLREKSYLFKNTKENKNGQVKKRG
jgi:DNA-directed RNA polymerase sigma subunit (sigma70/sigma32)